MVYVEENEAHHSPASFVRSNLTTPTSQIDYRRIIDHFFAVSGESDGRIFLQPMQFSRREKWTVSLHFPIVQDQRKGSLGRHRNPYQSIVASKMRSGAAPGWLARHSMNITRLELLTSSTKTGNDRAKLNKAASG
jgi:hypothetical protein